jgi:DNA invertase Pin-like site-specific DNA recombinase
MGRIKYQEAAGLIVKRGRPTDRPTPLKEDLVRLYVLEGRSIRDVSEALGCTKDAVHRGLKKYGIEARTPARRSQLRTITLDELRAAVRMKGIRGTARELDIDHSTLLHHLKVRNGQ